MSARVAKAKGHPERGVALVIAIFTLMLISVVATALILMAGTQAAMKGNYKSAMHAFYDAKAGLEEGRGRLWVANPNDITNCVFPTPGNPMPMDQVCYIVNPSPGEPVDPTNLDPLNPYADFEYQQEWGKAVTAATGLQPPIASTSPVAGITGPLYKWVRITPRTEFSAKMDVDGSGLPLDQNNPLFFDGKQQLLSSGGNPVAGASQVLTITSLSFTPNGSKRLVQYTVAQTAWSSLNLGFGAALNMIGPAPWYEPPRTHSFHMNGNDRSGGNAGACTLVPVSPLNAIGLTDDPSNVISAIAAQSRTGYYLGAGSTTPSVADISSLLPASEQTVPGLESLVQTITNLASEVVTGPTNSLPNYGSPSNPVVAVVQGDFNASGFTTGYGILLVTGRLNLSSSFGWRGVVLVIGQGIVNGDSVFGNEIDGAVVVAKTRDTSGNLLATLGTPHVDWSRGRGNGFYYDSCWINGAISSFPYQVLSFRELSQLQ